MAEKNIYNKETYLCKYNKVKHDGKEVLGKGGNAIVFPVIAHGDDKVVALKHLKTTKDETTARFISEIDSVLNNTDIEGIMPILDYDKSNYWYTMPLATEVLQHIEQEEPSFDNIIKNFILLCCTFEELHKRGYYHRDIKPQNLYYYKGRFCVGDFGLVDFPENPHNFTTNNRGVGAIFTIAPEMKRNPLGANGESADVYSLAKTLWMLLTKDQKGFDGPYDYTNPSHALRLRPEFSKRHLAELELLLVDATSDNPQNRPSVKNFKDRLLLFLSVSEDWQLSGSSDWMFLNQLLFKAPQVDSCCWRKRDAIVDVLKNVVLLPADNHTLFSSEGGLDLKGVEVAAEKDCIELQMGAIPYILKPKVLFYETFSKASWNYMLLEVEKIEPVLGTPVDDMELLVEDVPGHYVSAEAFNYGVYSYEEGKKLPDTARRVYRMTGGKLLIVLKCGTYNMIPSTYDGRHGRMSHEDFRTYIECLIAAIANPNTSKEEYKDLMESKEESKMSWEDDLPKDNFVPDNYIDSKIDSWLFSDCMKGLGEQTSKLLFSIEVCKNHNSFLDDEKWLLEDGKIGMKSDGNKPAVFKNREDAMLCKSRMSEKLGKYVREDGYEMLNPLDSIYFALRLKRIGMSSHLFSKEEIAALMRAADDRISNVLVIDEDGFARIVPDSPEATTYPVTLQKWYPKDNIVGKYSTLSELETTYRSCLYFWLNYLRTGEHQGGRYYDESINWNDIQSEIHTYYEKT